MFMLFIIKFSIWLLKNLKGKVFSRENVLPLSVVCLSHSLSVVLSTSLLLFLGLVLSCVSRSLRSHGSHGSNGSLGKERDPWDLKDPSDLTPATNRRPKYITNILQTRSSSYARHLMSTLSLLHTFLSRWGYAGCFLNRYLGLCLIFWLSNLLDLFSRPECVYFPRLASTF